MRTILCPSTCHALAHGADGVTALTGHFDGTLRLWDVRAARAVGEVAGLHAGQVTSVSVSLAGESALTCGKDSVLCVVDARVLGAPRARLTHPAFRVASVWCAAALGPDAKHATAGSAAGTVFVWEVDGGGLPGGGGGAGGEEGHRVPARCV